MFLIKSQVPNLGSSFLLEKKSTEVALLSSLDFCQDSSCYVVIFFILLAFLTHKKNQDWLLFDVVQ